MRAKTALLIIAGVIAVIAIGIYAGNQALIQNEIDQATKIDSLNSQLRNCTTPISVNNGTDVSSIKRAFDRCFTDFSSSSSAKTCINYLRFKDCITTAMGRFK